MLSTDATCGTYAGFNRHNRLGEKVCPECRAAATEYTRWWRFRTGRQAIPRCPDCGSVFPSQHLCQAPQPR